MQFTLKQLAYFVATGEAGSILRAAENIHVSQPSISNAITHLEDVFQVQLFIRHHARGMSLTTAGSQIMEQSQALLRDADELRSFAGKLSDQVFGSINVGCFTPLAPIVTPELCHGFMQSHEGVEVNVSEGNQAELLSKLKKGAIDLALTYNLQLESDIAFTALVELKPYVLLAADHALAGKASIALKSLADERFILLDLPLSDTYFMSLFESHNIKPNIYARTCHIEVQRALVAQGYGYSLGNVRPINQHSLDGSRLSYVPLSGFNPGLTLGMATLANSRKTIVVDIFSQFCRQQIRPDKIPGMARL
ncbi:MAG TPA: LysR substrate-binding domain-containing protein [Gammaproteobacteria bacterium]|nr:LysR substrate-binding domain-containing protein [Gammaproteobacteria bacterium]